MLENIIGELSTTNILLAISSVLISLCIWTYIQRPKNLPPGPKGLPLVGFWPFLKKDLLAQLQELGDEYGDVFSFYLGRKLIVVLNSYEAIKEALVKQKDTFSGRPLAFNFKHRVLAFFNVEGDVFRDHKRFSLATLKDFGFGKNSLEPQLKEEVSYLLEKISSFKGIPTDIGNWIRISVSNVICALINGKRYDYEDEKFQMLVSLVGEHISRAHPIDLPVYFPEILKIPGVQRVVNFFIKTPSETNKIFERELGNIMKARATTHQPGMRDDFISAWFTETEERKKNGTDKNFTMLRLTKLVQSLFLAGTDTTANSIRWTLMYLITYPEIQKKLQNEIDEVIGHERTPSLSDQEQMPYTSATIMEVQRISSLVPLSLLHSNFEETKLQNFTIPKRTVIVPNLWAVHHDPKTYPEPHKFNPERFLDKDRKLIKTEKFIPFSQGKRQCLGESLARMELFTYLTSLLQKFSFQLPKDETLDFNCDISVVAIPKPFRIQAIERKTC